MRPLRLKQTLGVPGYYYFLWKFDDEIGISTTPFRKSHLERFSLPENQSALSCLSCTAML